LNPNGRRYSDDLKAISTYLFLRSGPKLYDFLCENALLPTSKTINTYINKNVMKIIEGKVYTLELLSFLKDYNLPKSVCVAEDDTKILEVIEFNGNCNCLSGLVAPVDNDTGFPFINYFKATNAFKILHAVKNGRKSTNVHMILAKAIHPGNLLFL
jgi:hypothetical protein